MAIAITLNQVYSLLVVKKMATGFDSLYVSRRTHRPHVLAVFLRPHALVRLLWAGYGRGTFGYAGFLERQSVNLAVCPPTLFDSRERVNQLVLGGHHMANTSISARPEQTHTPHFSLAARAARKAVRQWFGSPPTQTLAQWRDTCRLAHCGGLASFDSRSAAFDRAFAHEVGKVIAGGYANG